MEYSPKAISNTLKNQNFNFKKKYGQNFIVDKNIIHSIINKSKIDKETLSQEQKTKHRIFSLRGGN